MTEKAPVVIIGTGFAGLAMGIALKKAGKDDFVILEKAREVGGTWRENTYPGCACDIMSLLYSYSFEPKRDWSRLFPRQDELLDYIRHCVDKYGLGPHIRFGAEVTHLAYDDENAWWEVHAGDGDVLRARALVSATGPLHLPNIPDLPGLAGFKGNVFHSAEWDHAYDLTGKRVAVIGTGASAIQFVPQIAPQVESLALFQRTPPWIMPKFDRPITGIERWLFRNVPGAQRAYRNGIYLFHETFVLGFEHPRLMRLSSRIATWHLNRQVHDPALRRALTPAYTMGCKRTLLSSDYYPSLNSSNVRLVTDAIAEIGEDRIVTKDGTAHQVDAIIFGTGFQVTDAMEKASIAGSGGIELQEAWKNGVEAHLGVTVAGFPNLFFMVGPNTGLGHNSMIFMIEAQVRYVMQCLEMLESTGARRISVRRSVQDRFNRWVERKSDAAVWTTGGCVSWYLDRNGKNRAAWPASTVNYWLRTRRLRAADFEFEGATR